MKKIFRAYVGVWAICLVLFNAVSFIVPNEMKHNFWVGYVSITLAFFGQLFCANKAFQSGNAQKFFYNFPFISGSFIGTLIMLIIGGLTMAISQIPVWVGVILCLAVFAFTAIAVINTSVASKTVSETDEKNKVKTEFIKMLTADAQALMTKAASEDVREITKKVYETVRYSDPMGNDALSTIEAQITARFEAFENAVCENSEKAILLGKELILLLEDRNRKCQLLK